MYREDYMRLVNEYFNIHDDKTRKTLLAFDEADQNQIMANLAAKLYVAITKKVADIDFGKIPESKGDIAQIPNFPDIMEALETIRNIIVENKQSTASIDILFKTVENLKNYRSLWQKGFSLNCEVVELYYNTVALSFVSATSLYIAASVEMVKDPTSGTIDIELARMSKSRSKDSLLLTNLAKFNKSCENGEMEKAFSEILKGQKAHIESTGFQDEDGYFIEVGGIGIAAILATGVMAVRLITCIIPILHWLTTMLYNLRQNIADYLEGEAEIIRLNAEKVNYDTSKTQEQRKKIIAKQIKIADRFTRWADKLTIRATKAQKDTERDVERDNNEKIDIDDVNYGTDSSIF